MSSYQTPIVHQGISATGSRSSSQSSTYSSPRSYTMGSSNTSGGSYSEYRSAKADGFRVKVSHRGNNTVIEHRQANPSTDEPSSRDAGYYDYAGKYHRHSSKKSGGGSSSRRP